MAAPPGNTPNLLISLDN